MEKVTIKGDSDYLTISFEEVFGYPDTTCHWGGYETRTHLEIKSSNFNVSSTLWTSTGELFSFFEQLKNCNETLKGQVSYKTYEGNLILTASYDGLGHVKIEGEFIEYHNCVNRLSFEFESDQSYIKRTIEDLSIIALKYGDNMGIKSLR